MSGTYCRVYTKTKSSGAILNSRRPARRVSHRGVANKMSIRQKPSLIFCSSGSKAAQKYSRRFCEKGENET